MGNKELSSIADLKRKQFWGFFTFSRHSRGCSLFELGGACPGWIQAGQEVPLLMVSILGMLSMDFTLPNILALGSYHHLSYLHCSDWFGTWEKAAFRNEEPAIQCGAAGVILGVRKKAGRKQNFDLYRAIHLSREIFLRFLESASSPAFTCWCSDRNFQCFYQKDIFAPD